MMHAIKYSLGRSTAAWLAFAVTTTCLSTRAEDTNTARAKPAGPREISTKEFLSYSPVFVSPSRTFDPMDLARESWKGWISKRPEPWGTTTDFTPTTRLPFDCRALPWPSIKEHSVDGPDNNMRAIGGLALLHCMLGDEMKDDPAEKGIISYLEWCTDPISGIPFSPDATGRGCAVGHGEHTKNLLLMYKYTGNRDWLEWGNRALKTLRYYAVESDDPDVGKVATYYQGMFTPGQPRVTTGDPTMGGWLHLALGWNLWAFSEDYELTGDNSALDFAEELGNRLCHGADPDGNDGTFRPDGSFGGKSQASVASWHMHGHTHCLPGLTELGVQLIKAGRRKEGLRYINQVSKTFDWLYDPNKNPDAGSMTGWLGEWLMVATGWPRESDCEGCTVGDVVQTACVLAATSRLDPSLSEYVNYYDRAEQIFTGQLYEQRFRLTPRYLAVVHECIEKHIATELTNATPEARAAEVEKRYQQAVKTGERMVGQQMGICGFPDWVNQLPSDLDPTLPGIHMQGCCADATIRGAYSVWAETVTGDANEARINLAFNRKSSLVDVASCLPYRGELDLTVNDAKKVLVRIPEWAPKDGVRVFRAKEIAPIKWDGSYVVFEDAKPGEQLTVTYPLRVAEVKETVGSLDGKQYTERWRGNTIVDISPGGKWIPMFQRPELDTEHMPD
jgi:hypothetical protein